MNDKDRVVELEGQVKKLETLAQAFMLVAMNHVPHDKPHTDTCNACSFLKDVNAVAKKLGWEYV